MPSMTRRPDKPGPVGPDASPWLHAHGEALLLDVLVVTRASRTRLVGVHDGRLRIQLAAAPVEGQANAALVRFLSEQLEVPRAQIEIVGGLTNRRKTVRLLGLDAGRVLLRLAI
jgi:hypothetical protein